MTKRIRYANDTYDDANQPIYISCTMQSMYLGDLFVSMPLSIQKAIILNSRGKKTYCCMEHYHIWVFPKIVDLPKMDGENNGTPYLKWDDLGGSVPTI